MAKVCRGAASKAIHTPTISSTTTREGSSPQDASRRLAAQIPASVWYALGAFVLFRLFDIFKPLGIRRMESLPGGIGVMMDDILSGVYGFIILIVARWIIS